MRRLLLPVFISLCVVAMSGCSTFSFPSSFTYQEIPTQTFTIASWSKLTDSQQPVRIYIEGDGYAYNAHGNPSYDPTPRNDLVRRVALGDPEPNVIYLARPCQYVKSTRCQPLYWTTARFSKEVIEAERSAIQALTVSQNLILIGYSGGAQVAGLLAVTEPRLPVKKVITIAGNLDHPAWTQMHRLIALKDSLSLTHYRNEFAQLPQVHFVGSEDKNIVPTLVKCFVDKNVTVIEVNEANHNKGWDKVFDAIWNQ